MRRTELALHEGLVDIEGAGPEHRHRSKDGFEKGDALFDIRDRDANMVRAVHFSAMALPSQVDCRQTLPVARRRGGRRSRRGDPKRDTGNPAFGIRFKPGCAPAPPSRSARRSGSARPGTRTGMSATARGRRRRSALRSAAARRRPFREGAAPAPQARAAEDHRRDARKRVADPLLRIADADLGHQHHRAERGEKGRTHVAEY